MPRVRSRLGGPGGFDAAAIAVAKATRLDLTLSK